MPSTPSEVRKAERTRPIVFFVVRIVASGVLAVLIVAVGLLFLLGHKDYVVRGTAHIASGVVRPSDVPAIVCVGQGGPLESSGVYADETMEFDDYPPRAHVLCSAPRRELTLPYSTNFYGNSKPRRLHAYVWLERHPELTGACEASQAAVVRVPTKELEGHAAGSPKDRPCFRPQPNAVLGYGVAFKSYFSDDEETIDVRLVPNGYPTR